MSWFRKNHKMGRFSELEAKEKIMKSINRSWEHMKNDKTAFILGSPELTNWLRLSLAVKDVRVFRARQRTLFPSVCHVWRVTDIPCHMSFITLTSLRFGEKCVIEKFIRISTLNNIEFNTWNMFSLASMSQLP